MDDSNREHRPTENDVPHIMSQAGQYCNRNYLADTLRGTVKSPIFKRMEEMLDKAADEHVAQHGMPENRQITISLDHGNVVMGNFLMNDGNLGWRVHKDATSLETVKKVYAEIKQAAIESGELVDRSPSRRGFGGGRG